MVIEIFVIFLMKFINIFIKSFKKKIEFNIKHIYYINMEDIKSILQEIKMDILQLKEEMNISNIKNETLYNEIHTKVDIICNFESTGKSIKKQEKSLTKKPDTKITYFKKEFKKDIQIFINKLYTQNDIDTCMNHDDVKSKNTQTDKIKKLADIIYKDVVNVNIEYKQQLTNIYKDYVKKLTEPEIINTEDE